MMPQVRDLKNLCELPIYKENVGISICSSASLGIPQPTLVDEQSDTHVVMA